MINEAYKANFETLRLAFKNGDTALVECTDANTGEVVIAICAVFKDGGSVAVVPLAKMFNGNPYEELMPPCGAETVEQVH
jgi:hypothetical protein